MVPTFCYTKEMIDRSIVGTARVENKELGTLDYVEDTTNFLLLLRIDRTLERGKLVAQMGTGEAETALGAALHVHCDVDAIDINMTCPKKFSVTGGMGSTLLNDPDRACNIITKVTDTISSTNSSNPIPVSAKVHLLKDTASTVDFVMAVINAVAKAVAIHGRHPGDPEVQAADWASLETVTSLLRSKFPLVPILVNGDFYTHDEFTTFQHKTGAAGVRD
jgi:tRNA-dihydrouridine synthase 2